MYSPDQIRSLIRHIGTQRLVTESRMHFYLDYYGNAIKYDLLKVDFVGSTKSPIVTTGTACYDMTVGAGSVVEIARGFAEKHLWWNPEMRQPDIDKTISAIEDRIDSMSETDIAEIAGVIDYWKEQFPHRDQAITDLYRDLTMTALSK